MIRKSSLVDPAAGSRGASAAPERSTMVGGGRALRVQIVCAADPDVKRNVIDLIEGLGGVIQSILVFPGPTGPESTCDVQFVPRSALTAGEILRALYDLGSVVFQPVK